MRGTPVIYYASLNRTFQVAGVDRPLFFLILGVCLPIAYSGHLSLLMDAIALGLFIVLHTIGIFITRADRQMLEVFRRHMSYRRYYAPVSGIHAKPRRPALSVPVYEGQRGLL